MDGQAEEEEIRKAGRKIQSTPFKNLKTYVKNMFLYEHIASMCQRRISLIDEKPAGWQM